MFSQKLICLTEFEISVTRQRKNYLIIINFEDAIK